MKLAEFSQKYQTKKIPVGKTLVSASKTPSFLYYLKSGFVKRYVNSMQGHELTVHIFEKGAIFPLSWALNDEIPDYFLIAFTPIEVNLIPKTDFLIFLQNNPLELMEITKRMTKAVEGLAKRVEILSYEKADTKLLSILHYLSRHFGNNFKFTHEQLATLTGLSRERVSIEMKGLRDKNIIDYRRGKIFLNNLPTPGTV